MPLSTVKLWQRGGLQDPKQGPLPSAPPLLVIVTYLWLDSCTLTSLTGLTLVPVYGRVGDGAEGTPWQPLRSGPCSQQAAHAVSKRVWETMKNCVYSMLERSFSFAPLCY